MSFKKLAHQTPSVISAGAEHMRKLAQSNVELAQERDAALHELRAIKLARRMDERGIDSTLTFEEKVAMLRSYEGDRFNQVEGAVELASGGAFSLGRLQEQDNQKTASGSAGSDTFDPLGDFIMSGAAYGS